MWKDRGSSINPIPFSDLRQNKLKNITLKNSDKRQIKIDYMNVSPTKMVPRHSIWDRLASLQTDASP